MQWLGTLGGQAPHLGCGLARCGHPGHRGRCGPYIGAVARPAIHVPTPQRHPLPPSQPPPPPPRPPFLISVAGVRLVERLPRPCRWRCWRLCRGAKRGPRAMLLTCRQQVVAASTTAGGGGTSVCVGNRFGARAAIVALVGRDFLAQADCPVWVWPVRSTFRSVRPVWCVLGGVSEVDC